jgi:hypothetical protein
MSQDTSGAEVPTWTDAEGIPCLFGNPTGALTVIGDQRVYSRSPSVILPAWVALGKKCLIVATYAPGFERTWTPIAPILPAPGREGFSHFMVQIQAVE